MNQVLEYLGVSSIRTLTAKKLKALTSVVTIYNHKEPIAVIVPYGVYCEWQKVIRNHELSRPKQPPTT